MYRIINEAKREERDIKSNLTIMIQHMLKCKYQFEYPNKKSWRESIRKGWLNVKNEFQAIGKGALYKNYYLRKLDIADVYADAVDMASEETGLSVSAFPNELEWTREQLMDRTFLREFIETYGFGSQESIATL